MTNQFSNLVGAETQEIIDVFIQHVTKTDGEIAEEGRDKKKSSTELKVYIAENGGLNPDDLNERILELLNSESINHYPEEYFTSHNFKIHRLNDEVHHLVITTPKYERSDDFILINSDGYLKALTVIRKSWADDTIEKLIEYIPELDRLFLSSNDLESIVEKNKKRDLTGFTAKYKPFYKDERVSIQVHGGGDNHLEQVEEQFGARPKRIVFSQRNSPAEAVKGAVSQDGYASIPRVRKGSEEVGYETIEDVIESYQEQDKENFKVTYRPERLTPGDRYFLKQLTLEDSSEKSTDGGISDEIKKIDQGSVLEGLTICEFEEEMPAPDYPDDQAVATQLEEEILDFKQRYSYSTCKEANYLVYDRTLGESFEVVIEDKNIRVYAKANTTARSLREFANIIDGEFNSTYSIEKVTKKVRA